MSQLLSTFALLLFIGLTDPWQQVARNGYIYFYQSPDQQRNPEYQRLIATGMNNVRAFTGKPFPKPFDVFVHPTRASWDKKLQDAYQMPDFKSECWMVASGDGFQLNMISPATWDAAACEHATADTVGTRQLITHELFHVFHGQHNASPDFSELDGLDWLAEGFATYASGQLTPERLAGVKELAEKNSAPARLDDFWKGKHRYGLSGSVVAYLDARYGRDKLLQLLAFSKKAQVLEALNLDESKLLEGWRAHTLAAR